MRRDLKGFFSIVHYWRLYCILKSKSFRIMSQNQQISEAKIVVRIVRAFGVPVRNQHTSEEHIGYVTSYYVCTCRVFHLRP